MVRVTPFSITLGSYQLLAGPPDDPGPGTWDPGPGTDPGPTRARLFLDLRERPPVPVRFHRAERALERHRALDDFVGYRDHHVFARAVRIRHRHHHRHV